MSLIYQALKQTEQHWLAKSVPVMRPLSVKQVTAGTVAATTQFRRFSVRRVLSMVGVGALMGLALSQWITNSTATVEAEPHLSTKEPFVVLGADTVSVPALPRAELPLPTLAPHLKLSYALLPLASPQSSLSTATLKRAQQVIAPTTEPDFAAPLTASAGAIKIHPTQLISNATTAQVSSVSLSELFERLNRALANGDQQLAQRDLTVIQQRLPEASVARLRAEAWFAHQSGDVDGAAHIYHRLLLKLPGDEHVVINLASIEKKFERLDRAKEILSTALQHNPTSSVLRTALNQLAQTRGIP